MKQSTTLHAWTADQNVGPRPHNPRKRAMSLALSVAATALGAAAIWALSNVPAASQTADEEAAFTAQVRQTLLNNPEILLEVFAVLEAQKEEAEAAKDRDIINSVADELFQDLDPAKPILVEFQDYNCGYCRRAHATLDALKQAHPDLQLVLMEFPILGEGSRVAAETALAVKHLYGAEAYANFADGLMNLEGPADHASAARLLEVLGHDAEEVKAAIADGVAQADLRDAAAIARKIGATGTPYFVGPGGIARGAASLDRLAELATPQSKPVETPEQTN